MIEYRRFASILIAGVCVLALAAPAGAAAQSPVTDAGSGPVGAPLGGADGVGQTGQAQTDETANDSAPPDPEEDIIGWEDGYWYNESISVDRSDGLNDSELEAVVSRGMARVEQIRQLEFQDRVPVEIISREEYRSDNAGRFANVSDAFRVHQNVKFESLFFVNESTDAIEVQQSTRGATVLGFYSPGEDQITIVSENTTSPKMDEITLSQELFHALQGQVFDAYEQDYYPGTTREDNNAVNGLIEGDGNYVDYLYQQRCEAEWDCLVPQGEDGSGGDSDINIGINVLNLPGYTEGPEFVQGLYDEANGWEAVNALYDQAPESTEQYIHPEKYPDESPVEFDIEDRSSDAWEVLELPGNDSVNYAEFGEAGLFTMFWYTAYEETLATQTPTTVGEVGYFDLFNYESSAQEELRDIGGYDYAHPTTDGFSGDRLLPYVPDQNASRSEAGYVWELRWDTPGDAEEFLTGYRDLLEYRGAEPVEGYENAYRAPEGEAFGDAFSLLQNGTTVTIVNGPTVDDLPEIYEGATAESSGE